MCGRVVCNACSTNRVKKPKITGYKEKVRVCDECWEDFAPNYLHRASGEATPPRDDGQGRMMQRRYKGKYNSQTVPSSRLEKEVAYQRGIDEHTTILDGVVENSEYYSRWDMEAVDLQRALSQRRKRRRETFHSWTYFLRRILCCTCCCSECCNLKPPPDFDDELSDPGEEVEAYYDSQTQKEEQWRRGSEENLCSYFCRMLWCWNIAGEGYEAIPANALKLPHAISSDEKGGFAELSGRCSSSSFGASLR